MQLGQLAAIIARTFALKRFDVDRSLVDADRSVVADNACQHERQNDLIIESQLQDHNDGHNGRVSSGGKKCAHANKGKRARVHRGRTGDMLGETAEKKSERRADNPPMAGKMMRVNGGNCSKLSTSPVVDLPVIMWCTTFVAKRKKTEQRPPQKPITPAQIKVACNSLGRARS
jgi:hypothetical protein